MGWIRNAAIVCACLMAITCICLYLLQDDLGYITDRSHIQRLTSISTPLSFIEYPSYNQSLTCNPILIESIPFPSPNPLPNTNPADFCQPSESFSTLDHELNVLDISESCPGPVQALFSDGYQVSHQMLPFGPGSIPLHDSQQIVIKCLATGHINTHIRVLLPDRKDSVPDPSKPHIIMLVVDSVARAQFIRQFPTTCSVLQKISRRQISDRYRVYGFSRYSTGGVGTAGNLVPILSGQAIRPWRFRHQLLDLLNVSKVERHEQDGNLLSMFKSNGYLTSLMDEGGPYWSSSLIRYFSSPLVREHDIDGILKTLTDWAFYPMIDAMLKAGAPFDPRLIYADSNITALCIGDQTLEQIEFQRLKQMLKVANDHDRPLFSVSLFNTGHEPRVIRAPTLDRPLAEFIEESIQSYENLAVILMSDHGIGYGPYAISDVGLFENKLPTLFMILPESLSMTSIQRQNLELNQDRLVFPLDLYATLSYFANPSIYNPDDVPEGEGSSLIHHLQPAWRNCTSVVGRYDVDYKFCACVVRRPLRSHLFGLFAQFTANYINHQASTNPACEMVHLQHPTSFLAHALDEFHRTGPERIAIKTTVTSPSVQQHPERSTNATEIFTGFFKRRLSNFAGGVDLEIGQVWDDTRDQFLGPVSVIDRDSHEDLVHVLIRSKSKRYLQRSLRIDFYHLGLTSSKQIMSFQIQLDDAQKQNVIRLGRADQFDSGRWWAILRSGNMIVSKSEFVVFDSSDLFISGAAADALLNEVWEVDTVRRDTEFGQYEICSGPTPVLSFCLCNISRPFTPNLINRNSVKAPIQLPIRTQFR